MSKPTRKICFVSVIGVLLCALAVFPASANSAQSYWEGVSTSGVLTTEGECPLVVEHETLTFDIGAFPSNLYGSIEDYLAYDASVTAEYTFYNPSDMTVTANLLFPFGITPYYGEIYDSEKGEYVTPDNASNYGAQINGAAVQTTVRHSYWDHYLYNFDPAEEMAKLHNDYRTDSFLTYDLPVHIYTYRISVDKQTYRSARAATYFDGAFEQTRFMLENLGGYHSDENGNAGWASVHTSDAEITVYVFGEDSGELEWKFYENGSLETEIEGSMSVVDKTSTTFGALAMQYYDPASGVAAHDWFNAAVAQLEGSDKALGLYGGVVNDWDFSQHLLQWYEYEITLAPGERLTNTVTAPLYPHINGRYEQPTYAYEYFLTPASTWTEFGTLDIYINTPYVMVKERKGEYSIAPKEWTKTDAGYKIHLDGLPDEDLIFTLCEVENPERVVTAYTYLAIGFIVIGALFVLAVIGIIVIGVLLLLAVIGISTVSIVVLIVILVKHAKKRKQKKAKLKEQENSQATPAGQDTSDETDEDVHNCEEMNDSNALAHAEMTAAFAIGQLIGQDSFLDSYDDKLGRLHENEQFMMFVMQLRKNLNGLELRDTKAANIEIMNAFFHEKINNQYDEVADIVNCVKKYGKQASAHISIYYAMYVLDFRTK